jgi:hypothetical protein
MLVLNMSIFNSDRLHRIFNRFAARTPGVKDEHGAFFNSLNSGLQEPARRIIARAQHPNGPSNGDSPICDAYESRFEELPSHSLQFERAHGHYAR